MNMHMEIRIAGLIAQETRFQSKIPNNFKMLTARFEGNFFFLSSLLVILILNNSQVSQHAFPYILHLRIDGTTVRKTLKPVPGDSFSQETGFLSAEKSCQKVSLIAFGISSPLPLNVF